MCGARAGEETQQGARYCCHTLIDINVWLLAMAIFDASNGIIVTIIVIVNVLLA